MWKIKTWESKDMEKNKRERDRFIAMHGDHIEYQDIFINNGYGIEYRELTIINIE